jgi:hypothetical protein
MPDAAHPSRHAQGAVKLRATVHPEYRGEWPLPGGHCSFDRQATTIDNAGPIVAGYTSSIGERYGF